MKPEPKAQAILFWDYDAQWGADRSRIPGGPKQWGHLEFENTELLLELHERYQVPACFAVVGSVALPGSRPYHDPAQIRRIHQAGHEVASHSFRHDWLPGLNATALRETLRCSKDALEQCIGAPVVSFVPPWNQPFDCPERLSISRSERKAVRTERTDLTKLCTALSETGYGYCRVAYKPLGERIKERFSGHPEVFPSRAETINGILCTRLNTPGGFQSATERVLEKCLETGGLAILYGHPHSIQSGNTQDIVWLEPLLHKLQLLQQRGMLEVRLPRQLLEAAGRGKSSPASAPA